MCGRRGPWADFPGPKSRPRRGRFGWTGSLERRWLRQRRAARWLTISSPNLRIMSRPFSGFGPSYQRKTPRSSKSSRCYFVLPCAKKLTTSPGSSTTTCFCQGGLRTVGKPPKPMAWAKTESDTSYWSPYKSLRASTSTVTCILRTFCWT